MKITDLNFPLLELLELIEDTAGPADINANNMAILLGGCLTARDDQGESGNIVFVSPGRHDTMHVTFKPLGGGHATTISVTMAEIMEAVHGQEKAS